MRRWEEREFAEREQVARAFWQMLKTSLSNQVGADNPYLAGVFAPLEQAYPWLSGSAFDGRRLGEGEAR